MNKDQSLVEWINQKKIDTFNYIKLLSRMSENELMANGYRNLSNAEAMKKAFLSAETEIEKRVRQRERGLCK